MAGKLEDWARSVKRDVHAIYLAARDPRTPWYAKALAICVAGYALSPIDLIPDFIPVIGYLDDAVIVLTWAAGIALARLSLFRRMDFKLRHGRRFPRVLTPKGPDAAETCIRIRSPWHRRT